MLKTFYSICLQYLVLISLFSTIFIFQHQQQDAAAVIDLSQNARITPVHTSTSNLLANKGENSTIDRTAQNSSAISHRQEQSTVAVKNFQNAFCGVGEITGGSDTNGYIIEHTLPQSCEMPLGIAVDSDAQMVWYVSTKRGVLGSYDLKQNKFF